MAIPKKPAQPAKQSRAAAQAAKLKEDDHVAEVTGEEAEISGDVEAPAAARSKGKGRRMAETLGSPVPPEQEPEAAPSSKHRSLRRKVGANGTTSVQAGSALHEQAEDAPKPRAKGGKGKFVVAPALGNGSLSESDVMFDAVVKVRS